MDQYLRREPFSRHAPNDDADGDQESLLVRPLALLYIYFFKRTLGDLGPACRRNRFRLSLARRPLSGSFAKEPPLICHCCLNFFFNALLYCCIFDACVCVSYSFCLKTIESCCALLVSRWHLAKRQACPVDALDPEISVPSHSLPRFVAFVQMVDR